MTATNPPPQAWANHGFFNDGHGQCLHCGKGYDEGKHVASVWFYKAGFDYGYSQRRWMDGFAEWLNKLMPLVIGAALLFAALIGGLVVYSIVRWVR